MNNQRINTLIQPGLKSITILTALVLYNESNHQSRPTLTLRSSVFIRGDLRLKRGSLLTLNMTNNGQTRYLEAWHIKRVFLPWIGMTKAIYQKNIYISLVADIMLRVYTDLIFNIRSPLMKTLDQSVETLGRECGWWLLSLCKTRVAIIVMEYWEILKSVAAVQLLTRHQCWNWRSCLPLLTLPVTPQQAANRSSHWSWNVWCALDEGNVWLVHVMRTWPHHSQRLLLYRTTETWNRMTPR